MLERTINDPEAMKLWVEVYYRASNPYNAEGQAWGSDEAASRNCLRGTLAADAAVDAFMLRFGDEHGRREWEDFKQAQKAGNAP